MRDTGISFNGVALAARTRQTQLITAFSRVIKRGIFLHGPEVTRFEKQLSAYTGKGHILSVSSGHDALLLALQALQLPKNTEVLFPVNSYPTAFPIALSGLKLIPVDCDADGQLNPKDIVRVLTKHTRVVVMTHLYGLVGDLAAILAICRRHRLILIEDAAQAFGSTFQGKKVGTIGALGCYSFYPTKNLGSLGEGGAVWTRNAKFFRYIHRAKLYGEQTRYYSTFISGHSRIPELQAAGLSLYFHSLPKEITRRRRVSAWYQSAWKTYKLTKYGYLLTSHPDSHPAPHLMVASVRHRTTLMLFLKNHHIPTVIHYPVPIHKTPSFLPILPKSRCYPNADHLARTIVSLPFHPYMRKSDTIHIVRMIRQFYETRTSR